MPFYPQFDQTTLDLCREALENGATDDDGIKQYVLDKLKSKELKYSVSDPEAPENFPRVWYIWRGNAIMGSMKGHEYALKHYLGTHHNSIAEDSEDHTTEVKWHEFAPVGKMDLIVDLNFRMDSSALYSDIVLPAASWYEKADLNSTDLHSFIHPLSAAIAPVWESKTDWNIFRDLAKVTSMAAEKYFSEPQKDIVASPIAHDSSGEIAQPVIKTGTVVSASQSWARPCTTSPWWIATIPSCTRSSSRSVSASAPPASVRTGIRTTARTCTTR